MEQNIIVKEKLSSPIIALYLIESRRCSMKTCEKKLQVQKEMLPGGFLPLDDGCDPSYSLE